MKRQRKGRRKGVVKEEEEKPLLLLPFNKTDDSFIVKGLN